MISKRVENAINVFLDALNNRTLAKGTCKACAVGNLAAYGMGMEVIVPKHEYELRTTIPIYEQWASVVYGISEAYNDEKAGDIVVENTGFTAVVKVMLEFDEVKESVQEVFTSKAELIPC